MTFGQASRAEAERRLAGFLPQAGTTFGSSRRYDNGPGRHDNVSGLSPYLRYRLISEAEVAEAVIQEHGVKGAEPFLQELLWRTYWKGWLEARPSVYLAYRRSVADERLRFAGTSSYTAALEGRTGLSAFDAWNQELIETGYLHHQARLAYASIWIFSLRLPWTLGAAHFQHHLIDGDPASNTLSWRHVAGLHTPGKHVLARAQEIATFTRGRFDLKGRLNESAVPLTGPPVPPAHLTSWPQQPSELLAERYSLLVTPDDLTPELTPLSQLKPQSIVVCGPRLLGEGAVSAKVTDFIEQALEDAKARWSTAYDCPIVELPSQANLGAWLGERLTGDEIPHLVYYQPSVGPWLELLTELTGKDVGLRYFPLRRSWDAQLFPLACKGYLQFQKLALPMLLRRKGNII